MEIWSVVFFRHLYNTIHIYLAKLVFFLNKTIIVKHYIDAQMFSNSTGAKQMHKFAILYKAHQIDVLYEILSFMIIGYLHPEKNKRPVKGLQCTHNLSFLEGNLTSLKLVIPLPLITAVLIIIDKVLFIVVCLAKTG